MSEWLFLRHLHKVQPSFRVKSNLVLHTTCLVHRAFMLQSMEIMQHLLLVNKHLFVQSKSLSLQLRLKISWTLLVHSLLQAMHAFKCIDIVLTGTKPQTRLAPEGSKATVCSQSKDIESRVIPLQAKWKNFISHTDNKADLAYFLSQQLLLWVEVACWQTIVSDGSFSNTKQVVSSNSSIFFRHLTRKKILRWFCIMSTVTHQVLSLHHSTQTYLYYCWYCCCIGDWNIKDKEIYCNSCCDGWGLQSDQLQNIPGFHAITGYHSTSFWDCHSKKSCW